ncbi:unnamed protein product [Larinioides sclopetarius]|uniref:Uncharacterized protein n=1 Tax=Larinioides sclopetarius TaxID=280406 RepID=A0AAV2AT88_9ARAC
MATQLKLVPNLSLKEMAINKLAVNLWIQSLINERQKAEIFDEWYRIVDIVKEKVLELKLQKLVMDRLVHILRPIGREILGWKQFHEYILNDKADNFSPTSSIKFDILKQLCWTCTGAVDERRTAELLIRLEMFDPIKCFRLACWYCLESYIPILWRNLPRRYKNLFHDKISLFPSKILPLEYYWAFTMNGEELKLNNFFLSSFLDNAPSVHQAFFKHSTCNRNKAATEYFYQKLTDEALNCDFYGTLCDALREETYIASCLKGKSRCDVFVYLLNLMTREQQRKVFKEEPLTCLFWLLDWPWQNMCVGVTVQIWKFIPVSKYELVLRELFAKMFSSTTCFYIPEVFQNFFMHSPVSFRKYFVNCGSFGIDFISKFLQAEDGESVKVILENLEDPERRKLLSNDSFCILIAFYMQKDRWSMVELCVGEATLSKEDRKILKNIYQKFSPNTSRRWQRFFSLLDGKSVNTTTNMYAEDVKLGKNKRLKKSD